MVLIGPMTNANNAYYSYLPYIGIVAYYYCVDWISFPAKSGNIFSRHIFSHKDDDRFPVWIYDFCSLSVVAISFERAIFTDLRLQPATCMHRGTIGIVPWYDIKSAPRSATPAAGCLLRPSFIDSSLISS